MDALGLGDGVVLVDLRDGADHRPVAQVPWQPMASSLPNVLSHFPMPWTRI